MKYQITITEEDYLQFNLFYTYHTNSGKHTLRTLQFMMPVFSVLILLLLFITGTEPYMILTFALVLAVSSVIMYFRAPKILQKNMYQLLKRMKKDGKLPYHASAEIEFQDSMIIERHEQGEFRLKYEDVEHIYFEEDYLYIFFSAAQALILPYRCLGNEKDRLTEFLRGIL